MIDIIFFFPYRSSSASNRSQSETPPPNTPPRMWTCTKCSYAYNPLWVEPCDICGLRRTPPSLTQPSLTTVTKEEPGAVSDPNNDEKSTVVINKNGAVKFSTSKSTHIFNDIQNLEVPIATFEQDLDDDLIYATDTVDSPKEWTCKKCTLVNSSQNKVCVVCGGSRLKSISSFEDTTLRKGEFWSCGQCTLKNALSTNVCIACKSAKQVPIISGQQTNYRPYTSGSSSSNPNNKVVISRQTGVQNLQMTSSNVTSTLAPPVQRVCRSPSPKYERNATGAIPKV